MGYYLNPTDGRTKEEFLEREGKNVYPFMFASRQDIWEQTPKDHALIVLVDNGPFTAAGVAFSPDEFEAFTEATDARPKRIYMVELSKLKGHVPEQVFDLLARAGRQIPHINRS